MIDDLDLPIFQDLEYFTLPEDVGERPAALDNIFVAGNGSLVYAGFWFQFTKRDRILWNHLLLYKEKPDPMMGIGAYHARLHHLLDEECFQLSKRPHPDDLTS